MNIDTDIPDKINEAVEDEDHNPPTTWRYSTAPRLLATTSIDVREPLPSPTLPKMPSATCSVNDTSAEPVSSGFTSPVMELMQREIIEDEYVLPPLPPSSPPGSPSVYQEAGADYIQSATAADIEQPFTEMRVFCEDEESNVGMEDSPTVKCVKRRSSGAQTDAPGSELQDDEIYMSETAEAAAESAKAKRRLLRTSLMSTGTYDIDPIRVRAAFTGWEDSARVPCPDPAIHRVSQTTYCPNPLAHPRSLTPTTFAPIAREHEASPEIFRYPADMDVGYQVGPNPHFPLQRTSATGSPMPFARGRARPTSSDISMSRARHPLHFGTMPAGRSEPFYDSVTDLSLSSDHFQPGWYHRVNSAKIDNHPLYSFSTAASKIVGCDQAPDSRIRDSYKTDTLTALALPPNRYRKNGIGAATNARSVNRFYSRPPSRQSYRPPSTGLRPTSRRLAGFGEDVRFRSSPPQSLRHQYSGQNVKDKFADNTNNFTIAEDGTAGNTGPSFGQSDSSTEVDKQSRTARRLSVLGTSAPKILTEAGERLRELSPNVEILRKGEEGYSRSNRTRRPSYWDNDLQEVRESPAGKGGLYSPVSTKQSMRAEVEIASTTYTNTEVDENDLVGEMARATSDLNDRLGELTSPVSVKIDVLDSDVEMVEGEHLDMEVC